MAWTATDRPGQPPRLALDRRVVGFLAVVLVANYALFLGLAWLKGFWLIGPDGQVIANDFVNVWAAGKLVLDGQPAAAYDWTIHGAAEIAAVGRPFDGYYGWHYPPYFLFVAAGLALVPYVPSYLAWMAIGLPAYAAGIGLVVRDRATALMVGAFPAVLWNISAGQNGFVTTALIAATLGLIERHPVAAGACLGLLTYKPQFGLLFPLALVAGRYWRVIAVAAAVGFALAATSWLAFGTATWEAFALSGRMVTEAVLGQGRGDFGKLQSVFGLVRTLGGSETWAWAGQFSIATAGAVAVWSAWRSRAPFALKAAAIAVAAPLATPYLFVYDLVVLAVPIGFLVRHALDTRFRTYEIPALLASAALVVVFPAMTFPVGLVAALLVAALVGLRLVAPGGAAARTCDLDRG